MVYDVVIIGSGLGGLECAHILSKAGMSVVVLERNSQPGGCIQSYRRKGINLDTGLHYIGGLAEAQSLHAAFRLLGLLHLPWHQLDTTFDRVTIGNDSYSFVQGYDAFAECLSRDFPDEREALRRYTALLRSSASQQLDNLNPHEDTGIPESIGIGAWQYLNSTFHDPRLIQVLSGTSLKEELRKDTLPLFTFLHCNSAFIESSWRLRGDGNLIVDSLISGIKAHGGDIVLGAEVTRLQEEDGRITRAVCTNGEAFEARTFISDTHPAVTCAMLQDSKRISKIYRRRICGAENTLGMFTVSLILQPQKLRYFNYNHYVYSQPDVWDLPPHLSCNPVGGVLVSCRIPEHNAGWAEIVDILTPMTWSTCERWEDTKVGRRGDDYKEMKSRMAEECVKLAERVIPDLHKFVVEQYTSTPLTYRDYTLTPNGSAYGIRKDFNSTLTTVLSPRTPIENLLLTGQNLILHGVHGVTMTSLFTCAELLGKEWIWNRLQD